MVVCLIDSIRYPPVGYIGSMLVPQTLIVVSVRGAEILRRTVSPGDYVVGSGKDADIVVQCDGVSARHAQISVNFNELLIEDLHSENGISVNGRAVADCVRIWPNQKIQIGEAVIEMHRERVQVDDDLSYAPQTAIVRNALPEEFLRERKYEIGGLVAEGGMGAILNAHEATTGRTVAMKVVLSNPRPDTLMRFIKEAQITSQLEHPNIVPLHELGVDEHDQVFYTMKMVHGITLRQVLEIVAQGSSRKGAGYSLSRLLTIFQKVCDAIGFAHSRGVIHRDLKPDNIMIGAYGEVLAMDWGLAKVLGDSTSGPAGDPDSTAADDSSAMSSDGSATMAGDIVGTPQYMSPEQARGDVASQDPRSDIYALGALLYQILALRTPVNGENAEEIIENARAGRIVPFGAAPAPAHWPIPKSLAAVAMKALAFDPARRYSNVQELQADIAAYQRGFATAAENAGLRKQLFLLVARHKREASILAASIAVLLGIAAFAFGRVTLERRHATTSRLQAESERAKAVGLTAQAVIERARAETERNRANAALAELRKAAPAFQGQAATLIEEQKFDEALEKNRLAIQLLPDDAGCHLFRAHTLAAMQRLPEAVASYRRVLELRPNDASAKSNLQLCERLLAEAAGKPLDRARQTQLLDAILAEKRVADSVLLAQALGRETDVRQALIRTRTQEPDAAGKVERFPADQERADGTFALDLSDLVVPDLSMLRGQPIGALKLGRGTLTDLAPLAALPLTELDCANNPVGDLSPLRALPLERLNLSRTKVTDLAALARLPLQQLSIGFTEVTDLQPLRGLPLQTLSLAGLPIRSIEPLRGLRLRELDLFACRNLTTVSPLAALAQLEAVNLPEQINDLSFVPQLRSLKRLGNSAMADGEAAFDKLPTVAGFISTQGQRLTRQKQFGPQLENLRNLLRKFGAPEAKIAEVGLDAQGFVNLDITGIAITDLSALRGLPIRNLVIKGTGAVDLTPLGGMPLVALDASENPLSNLAPLAACPALKSVDIHKTDDIDLRPLAPLKHDRLVASGTRVQDVAIVRGMPLMELDLSNCRNLTNLSPLVGCPRLETLLVQAKSSDAAIRQIPNLKRLSTLSLASFGGDWAMVPTTKDFLSAAATLEALRAELRKLGMPEEKIAAIEYSADGKLELDLTRLPIENLSCLAGLPIRNLKLDYTSVTDLSPLAGAPIKTLWMRETKISSLEGLRGAPLEFLEANKSPIVDLSPLAACQTLRALRIANTQVSDLTPVLHLPITDLHVLNTNIADLSPLAACETLEMIELSKDAPGTEALRKLPRLQRISSRFDGKNNRPDKTAEEFWREFDAQPKPPK